MAALRQMQRQIDRRQGRERPMRMAVIARRLGRGGTPRVAGFIGDRLVGMVVDVMSKVRTMFRLTLWRVPQRVANARHTRVRGVEREEQRQEEDDETAHRGQHHIITGRESTWTAWLRLRVKFYVAETRLIVPQ